MRVLTAIIIAVLGTSALYSIVLSFVVLTDVLGTESMGFVVVTTLIFLVFMVAAYGMLEGRHD